VAGQAMRLLSRLRIADRINPPVNVVISNVPGPNHPLYSAGAELKHFYPVSTISDGIALNLTVQSYNGQLDFGFVGDRDLVPDLWKLVDLLHEEMSVLYRLALAEQVPVAERTAPRRVARKSAATKTAAPKQAVSKKAATKQAATKQAATKQAGAQVRSGRASR